MYPKIAESRLRNFRRLLLFVTVLYWSVSIYRSFASAFSFSTIDFSLLNYTQPGIYQFFNSIDKESPNANLIFTTQSEKSDTINVRDYYVSKVRNQNFLDGNKFYLNHNQYFNSVYFINSELSSINNPISTEFESKKHFTSIVLESEKILEELGYSFSKLKQLQIEFFSTEPYFFDGKYSQSKTRKKILKVYSVDLKKKSIQNL